MNLSVSSPFTHRGTTVQRVMRDVLLALCPALIALAWFFGPGVLVNTGIAIAAALACEAAMLRARERPARPALADLSAVVTAVLLAMALPPLLPWWITVIGTLFAIAVAKHLFGGLGQNPFNPAMAGYVLLIVSFPREMTVWLAPSNLPDVLHPGLIDTLTHTLTGALPEHLSFDALSSPTPLDRMKTGLTQNLTVGEIRTHPLFGDYGGKGWEWIGNWVALGGLWLLWRRVITWHVPVAMLGMLMVTALLFQGADPDSHPVPLFHVFSGGALLGAFFIATDPVSGCSSPRGQLVFGAGVGLITFLIRTYGGYPDGVAFAVLLMNLAAPAIDRHTRPRAWGEIR